MVLLKLLFTLVLIYYALRLLYHLVVPAPVRQVISQMRKMNPEQFQAAASREPYVKPEGTVTVNKTQNATRKAARNENEEYTDYEEIK